ncbi:hypothetical protein KVR01_011664 [Diaporthe batatas]|uniref:uncharacterized protein n=1 Tax=Diaporthe batatas TaxID=748121 RepID=UPI001D0376DE|nr:uncharacterized protein KVR01_011664 [Diaporthe batatas]KAG8158542.1 hypothetical protein KVR01_011664 [Diaporthe batatas]
MMVTRGGEGWAGRPSMAGWQPGLDHPTAHDLLGARGETSILRGWRPLIEQHPPPFPSAGSQLPPPSEEVPPSSTTPVSQGADETGVPGAVAWTKLSASLVLMPLPLPLPLPLHSPCCACHPADAGMMRITGRQGMGNDRQTQGGKRSCCARRGSSGPAVLYGICLLFYPTSSLLHKGYMAGGPNDPLCCSSVLGGRRSLSPDVSPLASSCWAGWGVGDLREVTYCTVYTGL